MLLLVNNSKKEQQPNNSHNIIAKKISNIKNKKNKSLNKLIHNNSSSSMQFKNSKSKLYKYNKKNDCKRNKSFNNSISNFNIKDTKLSKNFEGFVSTNMKQKTPKLKQRINILNQINIKKQIKKEKSFFKKIRLKQLLTSIQDKRSNNSLGNKNASFTKYKSNVILKNNSSKNNLFLKEGGRSNNVIKLKYYGNMKNNDSQNKYSSFYQKSNKKQNITINRYLNNKNYKSKKSNHKGKGNISYEKYSENNSKIKLKKSLIIHNRINNCSNSRKRKNNSMILSEKQGNLLKKLFKKNKNIYMKTNQGNSVYKKNNSCSQENIFLNNNYNNFINLNYIDKNYNINNINISNRQPNIKSYKKINQKIINKKENHGFLQRRENNDLLDFLQMKLKGNNNNISTLQSRDEISLYELRKINSYLNLFSYNSSYNSISPEFSKLKHILEYKIKPYKNNKITKHNFRNHQGSKKNKDKDNINDNKNNQKTKPKNKNISNDKNKISINNKTNSDILSNISIHLSNLSSTTTKNKSYYISERQNLSIYIKKYFKEKGHYPKSNLNFYKYGRILGKGAFGKVNLALHIASGKLVAIKSFDKKKLSKENSIKKIMNEIEVLKKLRNNIFCTKIYDTFQTDTHILIVMEFICADLLDFIRKREKLDEKKAKIIFKQIALGLKNMHKNNIVHRDIKLDNLLLDLTNTIKICDFGVSKIIHSENEIMQDHCGTPAYIAPEVFEDLGYYGYGCDIWSLGVTLYYMLEGEQPFKGRSIEELKKNICSKNYQNIELISKEAEDLLDKMLTLNPEERITLDEILKHKWIKDVDIKKRNKMKLFSKHEKYLLEKYNVCYFKNDTEDLIENFEQENLNTRETEEKNGNTKSIILAPYNTFVTIYNEPNDYINNEIKIENNICKYKGDAQVSDIKYQMSNNDKFDNGVIKTIQACSISSLSSFSQNLKTEEIKSSNNLSSDNINKNIENNFCEDIIQEIEDKVGYDKNYLIQCLKNDEVNYATATYYLMLKDKEEKSDNNNFV